MILKLSVFISVPILTKWIDITDLISLDNALCNRVERLRNINLVRHFQTHYEDFLHKSRNNYDTSLSLLQWCSARGLKLKNVTISNRILNFNEVDCVCIETLISVIQSARVYKMSAGPLLILINSLSELQELEIHCIKDISN